MPVVEASIAHSLAVSVPFSKYTTCVEFQSIQGCRSANHERTWASRARMPGRTRETTKQPTIAAAELRRTTPSVKPMAMPTRFPRTICALAKLPGTGPRPCRGP